MLKDRNISGDLKKKIHNKGDLILISRIQSEPLLRGQKGEGNLDLRPFLVVDLELGPALRSGVSTGIVCYKKSCMFFIFNLNLNLNRKYLQEITNLQKKGLIPL